MQSDSLGHTFSSYKFNWETFDIVISGKSSLDSKNYLDVFTEIDKAREFLSGYGFDINDPVQAAELFGNFHESIQFIKRYFLKEGNPDGLDFTVPNVFFTIGDVSELLMIATGKSELTTSLIDQVWAGIILKVMHTILHADKDLRYQYFSTIQTQIFDRFYKYLHRDKDGNLSFRDEEGKVIIPLVEFETKAKKTRESIIIKLLHKQENVAEELFDRIGVRFITEKKIDVLRLIKFMYQNYIIMVNNIKPSRSQNSLIDVEKFKENYYDVMKKAIAEKSSEDDLQKELEELVENCLFETKQSEVNNHTSKSYKAVHFTCRQLIKYRNPFVKPFSEVRALAKEMGEDNELAKKVLELNTEHITKDIRFFYPFEVQITDIESHKINTEGNASHQEYKKSQLKTAMKRLFTPLIELSKEN